MKTTIKLFLLLTLFGAPLLAAQTEVNVSVNGMVCSFCAQGITKKFKSKPEVQAVKVVLQDQKVLLTLKNGAVLDDKDITTTLRESGYSVDKITRSTP